MMFNNVSKVLIRYNTESDGKSLCWRLLINDKEYLANEVSIQKPSFTSTDWLHDKQVFKHHISVVDCNVVITEDTLVATLTDKG